jgi:hypothetical protein
VDDEAFAAPLDGAAALDARHLFAGVDSQVFVEDEADVV